jgi:hypothetical protein
MVAKKVAGSRLLGILDRVRSTKQDLVRGFILQLALFLKVS